jgi:hypothetical protein
MINTPKVLGILLLATVAYSADSDSDIFKSLKSLNFEEVAKFDAKPNSDRCDFADGTNDRPSKPIQTAQDLKCEGDFSLCSSWTNMGNEADPTIDNATWYEFLWNTDLLPLPGNLTAEKGKETKVLIALPTVGSKEKEKAVFISDPINQVIPPAYVAIKHVFVGKAGLQVVVLSPQGKMTLKCSKADNGTCPEKCYARLPANIPGPFRIGIQAFDIAPHNTVIIQSISVFGNVVGTSSPIVAVATDAPTTTAANKTPQCVNIPAFSKHTAKDVTITKTADGYHIKCAAGQKLAFGTALSDIDLKCNCSDAKGCDLDAWVPKELAAMKPDQLCTKATIHKTPSGTCTNEFC